MRPLPIREWGKSLTFVRFYFEPRERFIHSKMELIKKMKKANSNTDANKNNTNLAVHRIETITIPRSNSFK